MESVPADILSTHAPQKIILNYIGESLYGDRIFSTTQKLDSNPTMAFLHSLTSENTQKEITRIKTVWKRSDEV
jgi:acyl-ACP thioesterase